MKGYIPLILAILLLTGAWYVGAQIVSNGSGGGGGGSGAGALGNGTLNSVNESSGTGAFTCDFSLGSVCLVTMVDSHSPLVPTLSNLPTNQFVHIIFNMATNSTGLVAVTWPTSSPGVFCNALNGPNNNNGTGADTWGTCGSGNWTAAHGITDNIFWSNGTNLYFQPAGAGTFQAVIASHVNSASFGLSGAGSSLNIGSTVDDEGGGLVAATGFGAPTINSCGSTPSGSVQSFGAAQAFTVTTGGTATTCDVNDGNYSRMPGYVCTDQTTAAALSAQPCSSGLTCPGTGPWVAVRIKGYTAQDVISCRAWMN